MVEQVEADAVAEQGKTPWTVVVFFVVALVPLALWAFDARTAVSFAFPLDYGEGPLLDQAVRLAQGDNVYRPLDAGPPWTVSNYPPVYPSLLALGVAASGVSYAWGRLLSVLSALAVAGLLAWVVRRQTADRLGAAVSGVVFLCVPYVAFWSTLQRVDLVGLALSWAGVAWLLSRPKRPVWPAAVLLVAAVMTRQTLALAAPGALFVWLLSRGERHRAWRLAWIAGGLTAMSAAGLQLATGGFFEHVVVANWNPWLASIFRDHAGEALLLLLAPLAASAVFARLPPDQDTGVCKDFRVFVVMYLVLAAASAATVGKLGSNVNYLLELSAAVALGCGALTARLRPAPRLRGLVLLALAIQMLAWIPPTRHASFAEMHFASARDTAAVLQRIEDTDGVVVSDEWLGLLPLARRDVVLQPFERTQLAEQGAWDQDPTVEWLRRGEAELVLLYRPEGLPGLWRSRWSSEMRAALEEAYVVTYRLGATDVLRPRRTAPGSAYEP